MEVGADQLKRAVEGQHGGTATPGATRAYAWSSLVEGGSNRFFAVLHLGGIRSPLDAVRAAIVAERKAKT